MNIAICDDYEHDCMLIKKYCEESSILVYTKCTTFFSGNEILVAYKNGQRFDVVFLDVDMPEINGIKVGTSIRSYDKDVIIIFITSYPEFAIDAYDCEAFNYLLKPCNPQKLNDVLARAVDRLKLLHKYHNIKIRNQTLRLPISEIYYIECCRKHILYHLKDDVIETTDKLSNVYDALLKYGFYQIHQGYIVNMAKIKRFDDYSVILEDGRDVMISVRKKAEVLIAYSKYVERYTR